MPKDVRKSKREVRGHLQTSILETQVVGLSQREVDLLLEILDVHREEMGSNPDLTDLRRRLLVAQPEGIS